MALLQDTSPGRFISRRGVPKSCNLTPLDFFSTLERLKTNIRQVMAEYRPYLCQIVVENYLKRINACNTSRGGHLNNVVLFHI